MSLLLRFHCTRPREARLAARPSAAQRASPARSYGRRTKFDVSGLAITLFCCARSGAAGNTWRASGLRGKSNSRAAGRLGERSRTRNGTIRNKRRFRCSVRNQDREARFSPLHAGPIQPWLSRSREGHAQCRSPNERRS